LFAQNNDYHERFENFENSWKNCSIDNPCFIVRVLQSEDCITSDQTSISSFLRTSMMDDHRSSMRKRVKLQSKDDERDSITSPHDSTPDYSIFFSKVGDPFRPISIDRSRTPQEQNALHSMLTQSINFLFGETSLEATSELSSQKVSSSPLSGDYDFSSIRKRKREDNSTVLSKSAKLRFSAHQVDKWDVRYHDLVEFRRVHDHCSVPYGFRPNPSLARWVKRQRYQYSLFHEGESSAMSVQRIKVLEKIGFIWDAQRAAWERRLNQLKAYQSVNGHCNVPASFKANTKLSAWVMYQRRHYRMLADGKASTMTKYRIDLLNEMDFEWEVRSSCGIPEVAYENI